VCSLFTSEFKKGFMYKDLDKKRAADRERQNRRRGKVVTPVTPLAGVTPSVTPEFVKGMGDWAKRRGTQERILRMSPWKSSGVSDAEMANSNPDIGEFTEKYLKPMIAQVAKNLDRPAHHPTCRCFVCVPPK
jgi:hypothetical protein